MTNSRDSEKSNEGAIPLEVRSLLTAFEAAVNRFRERNWVLQTPNVTHEQALAQVKQTLEEQLLDREVLNSNKAMFLRGAIAIETVFDPIPPSEETIKAAMKHALDDYDTFLAIRNLAVLGYGSQSPALRRFQTQFMGNIIQEPKKTRGPSISRDLHRNMIFASQIEQLKNIGINPTRSSATKAEESGCDLIVRAMGELGEHISYPMVERIWKSREKRPKLSFLSELLSHELMTLLSPGSTSD